MTGKKILEVVDRYEKEFFGCFSPIRIKPDKINPNMTEALQHLSFMCTEIRKFVEAGRIEKAFRWLGFMQGYLWITGAYSIEQLGQHNMPVAPGDKT